MAWLVFSSEPARAPTIVHHLLRPLGAEGSKHTRGKVPLTNEKQKRKCFYIVHVSSSLDRIRRFTLHPLADLFIPTPTRLIWESFQPRSNYVLRRLFHSFIFPQASIARYSFIHIAEWTGASWREQTKNGSKGDSNPASLDSESDLLPLSQRAPHKQALHTVR